MVRAARPAPPTAALETNRLRKSLERTEWLGDFAALVPTGQSAPWYESVTGKMMVAFAPTSVRDGLLQQAIKDGKETPPVEELQETREKGFAIGVGITGRLGIAAPILNNDGNAIAGLLVILSPSDGIAEHEGLMMELRDAADRCSSQLGFTIAHALL